MWVDALWFFQYFETYCTQSALMIGVCTINLSPPEHIRLTVHHLSNFQGGSHFQHGHFSRRSTQRFPHRPDKCPQMLLSYRISDQGNGIYTEILRCISPLLCCSSPVLSTTLVTGDFTPTIPTGSEQEESTAGENQHIYINKYVMYTALLAIFPNCKRTRVNLIFRCCRLPLVTLLCSLWGFQGTLRYQDNKALSLCNFLICVFTASTTQNS